MFSSWNVEKSCRIKRKSSPTINRTLTGPNSRVKVGQIEDSLERTSMLISLRQRKARGSMTVEAAILMPMVMLFFLHIMSSVEMLRLHGKLNFALWECGNQMTVYAAMPGELEEKMPDMAVSYLYVRNRVKTFLGREYLDTSPIMGGGNGLNYLSSSYDEDCIDIGVTYQVKPKITLFPFSYMRMANRYYGRAWTGFDVNDEITYVYITLYGEVWHRKADCTHIFITVLETDKRNIRRLRNLAGERYTLCELCEDREEEAVYYYTEQGSRYHHTAECPSLIRYISAVPWQETLPYRPCSRCVEEENVK